MALGCGTIPSAEVAGERRRALTAKTAAMDKSGHSNPA
jgi:hypothetical protein